MANERMYNAPPGSKSEIDSAGNQMNTYYYAKQALIEAKKEMYFQPLADVTAMPKHYGKKIKKYHYIPLLDDQNINDQGLDASGNAIAITEYWVDVPSLVCAPRIVEAAEASFARAHLDTEWVYITDSTQWLLLTGDVAIGYDASTTGGASGTEKSDANIDTEIDKCTNGITASTSGAVITLTGGTSLLYGTEAEAIVASLILGGSVRTQRSGNLYGSSKDVGNIPGKLPALTENGGRVNRVGFKRKEVEGTIEKFGFFDEYTQESMDFDSDAQLMQHINREMVFGANEITEDALQIDLLNNAGVTQFAGTATSVAEVDATVITYADLLRLHITLNNNRTPMKTKVITGTRMIDTKTIPGGRVMYVGSEMQPTIEAMKDVHNAPLFIPVQKYAAGGTVLNGEIGSVGYFRVVVVPEMMKWSGAGANAEADALNYETNNRYDVFPMLVVGEGSFSTIGFMTDGKTVKFKIYNKKPGEAMATTADPYGETGFMSIKWYYGFLALRPERIALQYSSALL